MKTTLMILTVMLSSILSLSLSAQTVDLKLPKPPASEQMDVGKGFMLTGAAMCLGSAFLVTNNSGEGKSPAIPAFLAGAAIHTTGMFVYQIGKRRN